MTASLNEAQRSVVDTLRAHWRLYVFEGVVMIVLGVLAIVFPVFATLAVALYLGGLFLLCGILALIVMMSTGRIPEPSAMASRARSNSYSSRLVLADFRCSAARLPTPRFLNDTTAPGARLPWLIRRRPVPVNT
jgi:hypothetical protein